MIRRVVWALVLVAMVSPPVDPFLDGSMSRHMLIQMPALLGLGFAAKSVWSFAPFRAASMGLSTVFFVVGSLLFWMLPRSLDAAITIEWADQLMHANLLAAGCLLAMVLSRLPFHTRIAFGVYTSAMLLAAGAVYASTARPICASYTIQQQNEAGIFLLWAGITIFVVLVIRAVILLKSMTAASDDATATGGKHPRLKPPGGIISVAFSEECE